ncbi:MAG: RIP metalloprotease RseP [Proteobacteria bacterium]|nr:RIP metalloprotease RseP [Desulfobulbaceae bacterium]MBU4153025.1 RIP metalloprotease RseP [Pseudomonadota bacterium]
MNSIVSFIIVLGVLIFVHEFGHFITAKFFGIKVLKFSLGFGPKIIAKQIGETEYLLSALPLGGYVKMLGEQPNETVSAEMAGRSFAAKSVWKRFMVVLAGPISNLISAIVIFTVVILITGIPHPLPTTEIGEISPGSAAEQAGLKPGDIVVAIDGKAITSWSEVSESVKKSGGKELTVSIKRGAELIDATGAPTTSEVKNIFGEVVDTRFLLGISQKQSLRYEPATLSGAFIEGVEQTWFYIELTVLSLWKIIQRVIPASQIGGPIMIAQMAGQQMEAGWISLFSFMAVLSVNLGIINLFPIPILDGGHLVFFSIEALRRKPLTLRAQEILQQVGMFLLGSLMLFVFYNDFARLFGKG